MRFVGAIEVHGAAEALAQGNFRLPAQLRGDFAVIAVIVADVNALSVGRKGCHFKGLRFGVDVQQQLRQGEQADRLNPAQVVDLTFSLGSGGGQQQRIHHIADVGEVADLLAIPENLQRFVVHDLMNPPAEEGLPGVLDAHVRPVGVGHAQADRVQAIDAVIHQVIPLSGDFVDAVNISRCERMQFIHGQILRPAINLPGAGEDDFPIGVELPAGFQDCELAAAINLQIGEGILHAVQMAHLSGEVEQEILALDQVLHAVGIPHVGDVDADAVADLRDVEKVAAIFRDQRIHQQHVGAQLHQPVRQMAADEPQSTGDQDPLAGEGAFEISAHVYFHVSCAHFHGSFLSGLNCAVRFTDDEFPPQRAQLTGRTQQSPPVKELGDAVLPVIVMDRHLGKAIAGILEFLDHFQADGAAVAREGDRVEERATDEAKITIHVAQFEAEHEFDEMVIEPPNDLAREGIVPGNFIAVDDIHFRRDGFHEQGEFQRIVLGVAVGIENPFPGGGGETGAQGGAIPPVLRVMDHPEFWDAARELFQHCGGVIAAAVVHHDDLEIICHLAQGDQRGEDHAGNRAAVVVGGKEGRNAGEFFHLRWLGPCHGGQGDLEFCFRDSSFGSLAPE